MGGIIMDGSFHLKTEGDTDLMHRAQAKGFRGAGEAIAIVVMMMKLLEGPAEVQDSSADLLTAGGERVTKWARMVPPVAMPRSPSLQVPPPILGS